MQRWLSRALWLADDLICGPWIRNRPTTSTTCPWTMQALLTATRSPSLALGKRAFASSARSWQAVPQQKPVLMKEFKIYRWVCAIPWDCSFCLHMYRIQMSPTKSHHCRPTSLISTRQVLWLARAWKTFSMIIIMSIHIGSRCSNQNQERSWFHSYLSSVLPWGYLWLLCYEHRWPEHPCLSLQNRPRRQQELQDLPFTS